jgi:hypothetical protein
VSAAATVGFDVFFKVVGAVVVAKFFSFFNIFNTVDQYFFGFNYDFAVGAAGVIDIASGIFSASAVNGPAGIDFKEIFASFLISFFAGEHSAGVFNDKFSFLDGKVSKKAQSGR